MARAEVRSVWCIGTLVLVAALSGGVAAAEVVSVDGMYGLSTVDRHEIRSEALETTYTLLVRVPESLSEVGASAAGSLPVVYLLDGGLTFPVLAAYYRYLRLGEDAPEMIVVGISYGTPDWRQGNQRSRDFTAPSPEAAHYGGVERFLDFLASSVFPRIEKDYPADPRRRILFGQSLGGQAVIYAAMNRPGLFWGHIASNPALHRNVALFLENPGTAASGSELAGPMPRLFVSTASEDDPRFLEPARRWIERWQGEGDRGWALETRVLEGHDHFSAAPEAFRLGLGWLFSEETEPPGPKDRSGETGEAGGAAAAARPGSRQDAGRPDAVVPRATA